MGLVDDFLANNTPTIPPTQQQASVQDLGFSSRTTREPTYTTTKTPAQTIVTTKDGGEKQTWGSEDRQTSEESTRNTQKIERFPQETFPDFQKKTGLDLVMNQLKMQKPTQPQDSDRMRKMAGIQAISEALRNVIDGVYGRQKAIIVPHKTYTKNFLDNADKIDAGYSKSLKEYYKRLDDNQKNMFESYLRKLAIDERNRFDTKVTGEKTGEMTGNKWQSQITDPTTSTRVVPEKTVTSTRTGGASNTTGTRQALNYGGGVGGGDIAPIQEIKLPDGSMYSLDIPNLRIAVNIAHRARGGKSYGVQGDALFEKIANGIPLSNAEYALFVQSAVNENPSLAKEVAKSIKVPQTQTGTGTTAGKVLMKETGNTDKKTTAKPTNKPKSKWDNYSF